MRALSAIVVVLAVAGCAAPSSPAPEKSKTIPTIRMQSTDKDKQARDYLKRLNSTKNCKVLMEEYDKQDTGDSPYRDLFMSAIEEIMQDNNCFEIEPA